MTNQVKMQFPRGQQLLYYITNLNKHFIVTLQRNVGGGTNGARGGYLETHGQDRTLRKHMGRAMTEVVCPPPPLPSASVTHSTLERA
jgi:hypothetical protein